MFLRMTLPMNYIVYKRFKGHGLGGEFNLPFGTVCREAGGFLHAPDGRAVCAATSENGWNHFRPNTPEGAHRQAMIDALKKHYQRPHAASHLQGDIYDRELRPEENDYWLHLLRTMETAHLEKLYHLRIGGKPNV